MFWYHNNLEDLVSMTASFLSPQNQIQFNTDMIDREDASVFRDANGNAVFYPTLRAVDQGTPPLSCETDVSSVALAHAD